MYSDAVARWKILHDGFISSITLYLDACHTLEHALAQLPQHDQQRMLDDAFEAVGKELPSLSACTDVLNASWSCLARLRNQSARLVPVNLLPPEILGNIFVMASPNKDICVQNVVSDYVPPSAACLDHIMGVCSRWRRIATATPALWSHVDLVAAGRWKERFKLRAQYRMNRAGNWPIQLHMQDTGDPGRFELYDREASEIVEFLSSRASRYGSLEILLLLDHHILPKAILRFLSQTQSPSILDNLAIAAQSVSHASVEGHILYTEHIGALDQLLTPVRQLQLRGTTLDWQGAAFHNLIELGILHLPEILWPRIDQLAQLFSSSPRLRRIKLGNFGISEDDYELDSIRTALSDLEELNLWQLKNGCARVLSLISPGSRNFNASIVLHGSPEERYAVRPFFDNSRVTNLFIRDGRTRTQGWVSELLGHLPYINQMAIDSLHFDINRTIHTVESWLNLRYLYLINCHFTSSSAFRVLDANHIQTLSLWSCEIVPSTYNDPFNTVRSLQDALFDRVPQLEVARVSPACPVWGWSCVSRN